VLRAVPQAPPGPPSRRVSRTGGLADFLLVPVPGQDRSVDLNLLDRVVAARRQKWEGAGAAVEIVRCGFDAKPAASLRGESSARAVELLLWVSGEADLTYAELLPRITDPRTDHYDLATPADLERCLDHFEAHLGIR
jgi:hypothetical protein